MYLFHHAYFVQLQTTKKKAKQRHMFKVIQNAGLQGNLGSCLLSWHSVQLPLTFTLKSVPISIKNHWVTLSTVLGSERRKKDEVWSRMWGLDEGERKATWFLPGNLVLLNSSPLDPIKATGLWKQTVCVHILTPLLTSYMILENSLISFCLLFLVYKIGILLPISQG